MKMGCDNTHVHDHDGGSAKPIIAVIAPGAMGAALAQRLTSASCIVLTALAGRSESTRKRAFEAGMQDVESLAEIVRKGPSGRRCEWILSILPPSEAEGLVQEFVDIVAADAKSSQHQGGCMDTRHYPIFVDCNAKSPSTARRLAALVSSAPIPLTFIDASIVGLPPNGEHNPMIYASAAPDPTSQDALARFERFNDYGLRVKAMRGDGVDIGDASALKMTFSGIMKGMVGLYSTMLLAAHAHSSSTADALIRELSASQPLHARNIAFYVPNSVHKAYRFVHEMDEMSGFLKEAVDENPDGGGSDSKEKKDGGVSAMYEGFARIYERVANSQAGDQEDVDVLRKYSKEIEKYLKD